MLPPSLHGHYPASSVVCSNPTTYLPSGFLTFLSLDRPFSVSGGQVSSPKLIHHSNIKHAELCDPGEAVRLLPLVDPYDVAFCTVPMHQPSQLGISGLINFTFVSACLFAVYA